MDQTPSTLDNMEIQDDDQYYQNHLLSESNYLPQKKFSISSNILLGQMHSANKNLEGYLYKKSPKLLVGWQKRYVKLNDGKLFYYKGKEQFKGCIDFHLIDVEITATYKNQTVVEIQLELVGAHKVFQFKAYNTVIALETWYQGIVNVINNLKSYPKIQLQRSQIWRHEIISHAYFKKQADTGDILLFKGTTTMSKIQRAITGDNFDHVALLLRYNNGELFIFESIGQTGVSLLSWDKFIKNKWHLLYKELVYRHLELNRSEELIEKLEKFIKQTIGKKYNISPSKLIKRFSNSAEDVKDYENDNKTFFCSELVAAGYKQMGMLSMDKCSASYWPGMFGQNQKLEIKQGKLQQELLIDFSLN